MHEKLIDPNEKCPDNIPIFLTNPGVTRQVNGTNEYIKKVYDDGVIVLIDTFDAEVETQFSNGDLHYEDPLSNEIYFIEDH